MIELPAARKQWECGKHWIGGELVQTKEGCGQLIYQSTTQKYQSGKYMILNAVNGVGGLAHEKHVCPNRVGSIYHHFKQLDPVAIERHHRHKFCGDCLQEFDSIRCPLCPHCFKLECRKCGNLRTWINNERIYLTKKDIGGGLNLWTAHIDPSIEKIDSSVCPKCGNVGMDVRQVFNAYQRLYGKYQF